MILNGHAHKKDPSWTAEDLQCCNSYRPTKHLQQIQCILGFSVVKGVKSRLLTSISHVVNVLKMHFLFKKSADWIRRFVPSTCCPGHFQGFPRRFPRLGEVDTKCLARQVRIFFLNALPNWQFSKLLYVMVTVK